MFDYSSFFKNKIEDLFKESRYRHFAHLERLQEEPPFAWIYKHPALPDLTPRKVSVWCSNDYLGLTQHPEMIQAHSNAAENFGVGSGGTRNIAGSACLHENLEKRLAQLHGKEQALLFSSGYVANETTLQTLGEKIPNVIFLSDEKIHASMIHGIRNSRAEKMIFKHNDMTDLEQKLSSLDFDRPKIIVVVSIYSMDGNQAKLESICDLAEKYNALIFLDEVHAVGIYGKGGAGIANQLELQDRIHIIQGNFAKGFGSFGGYISANSEIIDFIRSYGSGFIFTTSLPPSVVSSSIKALDILNESSALQDSFHKRVNYLKSKLAESNILNYRSTDSHIIPIHIGDSLLCSKISQDLLMDYSIYAQPINYPTVPQGLERLRVTVTPNHTFELIDYFVQSLEKVWIKNNFKNRKVA
ncbi:MAG: 5-aminolevulinate synthase [Candidatus Puniceispirillum sp.]|nr:5-aminolevulinate synthase [Candidatus Pelagibacter sp.]MBA4283175.1 5-aminolevulinate synthase [Candidatus Puniceispirillum sp.]